MGAVFTNPEDLIEAILEKVNPRPVMVPTIKEQMIELFQPGRAVAFRTESGSLYELNIYESRPVLLTKHLEDGDSVQVVASGELTAAHDRNRGAYGVVVTAADGRVVKTSAVVKLWLSFDATIEGPGRWFREPFAPCPVTVRGKACGLMVGANGVCSEVH